MTKKQVFQKKTNLINWAIIGVVVLLTAGLIEHLLRGALVAVWVDASSSTWKLLAASQDWDRRTGKRTVNGASDGLFDTLGSGLGVVGSLGRRVSKAGLVWFGSAEKRLTYSRLLGLSGEVFADKVRHD